MADVEHPLVTRYASQESRFFDVAYDRKGLYLRERDVILNEKNFVGVLNVLRSIKDKKWIEVSDQIFICEDEPSSILVVHVQEPMRSIKECKITLQYGETYVVFDSEKNILEDINETVVEYNDSALIFGYSCVGLKNNSLPSEIIQTIIDHADLFHIIEGDSPLFYALDHGNIEAAEYLLHLGASQYQKTKHLKKSVLYISYRLKMYNYVTLLLKYEPNPDDVVEVLERASRDECHEMVEELTTWLEDNNL